MRGTNALGNAQRRPDMQRLLLERGDLRPSDPELRDALLWARGEESARLLIAHGADLEARDRDGLTPYSRRGPPRRRGADGACSRRPARTRAPTRSRSGSARWCAASRRPRGRRGAALRHADAELLPMFASAGRDDVVERLLEAGVPLHARGIDDGTALHYAGMWGRPTRSGCCSRAAPSRT